LRTWKFYFVLSKIVMNQYYFGYESSSTEIYCGDLLKLKSITSSMIWNFPINDRDWLNLEIDISKIFSKLIRKLLGIKNSDKKRISFSSIWEEYEMNFVLCFEIHLSVFTKYCKNSFSKALRFFVRIRLEEIWLENGIISKVC